MYRLQSRSSKQNLSMSCKPCIIYHILSLKLFNGLWTHYAVLFSCYAFWEFPLMEGQIDLYEIVITAFLSNKCNHHHQMVKENRADAAVTAGRTRAGGKGRPITQCQITQQLCLSFVCTSWSCFLFLSAFCHQGDWWSLWRNWASCQSHQTLFPLSAFNPRSNHLK